MAEKLVDKDCASGRAGEKPLAKDMIDRYLVQTGGWSVGVNIVDGKSVDTLQKTFSFKDFREAMAFLKKIEELAENQKHHPDFCVHYNQVVFSIWTHSIGGLHENDFIMAAKINQLAGN